MAIKSMFGYFEVTNVSFSPKVITVGEETNCSVTIKNVSGKKITSVNINSCLRYKDLNGVDSTSQTQKIYAGDGAYYTQKTINWPNGESFTFNSKFLLELPNNHLLPEDMPRCLPAIVPDDTFFNGLKFGLSFEIIVGGNVILANGKNFDFIPNLMGDDNENLAVIDKYYLPKITTFDVERCTNSIPNDEGENLLVKLNLSANEVALAKERMSVRMWYKQGAMPDKDSSYVDLTSSLSNLLDSSSPMVFELSQTFDKAGDWYCMLWFGDDYESATASRLASRSFANVHLSGCPTGGVCFGGFSGSTHGNPLFQCYYPAIFNGPVEFHGEVSGAGSMNYSTEEVDTGGKWIDGRKIYMRVMQYSVAGASGVDYFSDVVSDNIMEILSIDGMLTRDSDKKQFPMNFYRGSNAFIDTAITLDGKLVSRAVSVMKGTVKAWVLYTKDEF